MVLMQSWDRMIENLFDYAVDTIESNAIDHAEQNTDIQREAVTSYIFWIHDGDKETEEDDFLDMSVPWSEIATSYITDCVLNYIASGYYWLK